MLPYQQAFGEAFSLGIDLPECFEDRSYKNDVCPCFVYPSATGRIWVLWIDDEEPEKRELGGCLRYTLVCQIDNEPDRLVLETDLPETVTNFLATIAG